MGWGLMVLELGMKSSSSDNVLESSSWGDDDDDDDDVVPSGTDPVVSAPVTAPFFSLAARRA